MTALDRARGWFIAPPESTGDEPGWCAAPPLEQGGVMRSDRQAKAEHHAPHGKPRDAAPAPPAPKPASPDGSIPPPRKSPPRPRHNGWQPPIADRREGPVGDAADRREGRAGDAADRREGPVGDAADRREGPVGDAADRREGPVGDAADGREGRAADAADRREGRAGDAADGREGPVGDAGASSRAASSLAPGRGARARAAAEPSHPASSSTLERDVVIRAASPRAAHRDEGSAAVAPAIREVTSAAVLGRTGEVEPVAAALALALRRQTRAATATVAVVGAALPELPEGGGAARKLGARLDAHGFQARVRGRLAWVRLDPAEEQLAAAARRVTLVGAPAVLAVTAPRNADTDRALLGCDLLVIVAADPEGPLANLAAAGLTDVPVVTVCPLGRGPARALARAGIRSTPTIRRLLTTEREQPS